HLSSLFTKLENGDRFAACCVFLEGHFRDNLPELAKLSDFLLKQIVGKRRSNSGEWFYIFLSGMLNFMTEIVIQKEDFEAHLDFFKDFLKCRFFVNDGKWRSLGYNVCFKIVGAVDETIMDISFPKGFSVDESFLYAMEDYMTEGCSLRLRRACRRILHSSDYVSEDDELFVGAGKACRKRRKYNPKNDEEY
ncbi:hypothetical protein MP638_000802, partial [Amoeboaphelidium occidentale]